MNKFMKCSTPLSGAHSRTYDRIFQHPISHNLEWHDVRALLGKLGEVTEEHNGNLKVTRNGEVLVLHASRTKDVAEMDDVMSLRHFLERSDAAKPAVAEKETHWLLVIDHHEARIFHAEMEGAVPQRILPHGPEEYFRHARDSKNTSRGQEKPDPNTYFAPVAKALGSSGPILIFGTGTGSSSEMEQFVNWSKTHHPEIAKRIVGSIAVDESHLSEAQLLVKARDFYSVGSPVTTV
jgi:hypothetical protein